MYEAPRPELVSRAAMLSGLYSYCSRLACDCNGMSWTECRFAYDVLECLPAAHCVGCAFVFSGVCTLR